MIRPAPAHRFRHSLAGIVARAIIPALLGLIVGQAAPGAPEDYDRWFTISMDGQRAGWMHMSQATAEGRVTTTSQMSFSLRRGEELISIRYDTTFVETVSGQPIRAVSRDEIGAEPVTIEYTFEPDAVTVVTTRRGRTTTRTESKPEGTWLPPAAAGEFLARRLAAGATQITIRTIDPGTGLTPVIVSRTVKGREEFRVLGKDVPVFRCEAAYSSQPGVTATELLDERGLLVRSESSMGEIRIEAIVSTRRAALERFRAPELMRSTFITPSREIPAPRRARAATYVLRVPDGSIRVLSQSVQQTDQIDERSVRVVVNLAEPLDAGVDMDGGVAAANFLKPSRWLDAADPVVMQLARRATRDGPDDPAGRAEAMRRFVNQHVSEKALDLGFASASEVARDGRGDCTEHAVLLAAMLRADGIPSRVVSGLIYATRFAGESGVFAFHMWTQALVETDSGARWVNLDATLPGGVSFDATHIAVATSALSDERSGDALLPVAELLGRLSIEVEKVR